MRTHLARLLALLLAAVALWGCGDDDESVATDDVAAPDGAALASAYVSVDATEDGEPRPLVDGTTIELTFDGDRIGATAGCNSMGGTYRLDGDVLVVEDGLSMTEIGCDPERHAQDEWVADLLTSRPTLAVDGDTLTLTSGATVVVLRDREVAEADEPLVGTTWEVDGFLDGTAADDTSMSMTVEQPATLELLDEGVVVGSDGCNRFGYATDGDGTITDALRYEVDGDRIHFTGSPPSHLVACDHLQEYTERTRAVLQGTATWEIDGDRLTLVSEDGRGVTYRAAASR